MTKRDTTSARPAPHRPMRAISRAAARAWARSAALGSILGAVASGPLAAAGPNAAGHVFEQKRAHAPRAPLDCAALASELELPRVAVTLAEVIPAGTVTPPGAAQPLPAHCRIVGAVDQRIGTDGKPYAIGFEMRMPQDWNRRFFFQGGGGNDGTINPAYGTLSGGGNTTNALTLGYAVVSTDAGHTNDNSSLISGAVFGLEPQARIDYGYNAVGTLTPIARQILKRHYGTGAKYSYFVGCSNGGRQGMVAAARYPELFDGIVAGNPGFDLPKAAVQHAWDVQQFLAVGAGSIAGAFSVADMRLVASRIVERCDALDGLSDGMIDNLPACQKAFDLSELTCPGAKDATCLAPAQVSALAKIFDGPRNSAGRQLYSDWPFDAGVGAGGWRVWKLEAPFLGGLPIIGALGSSSLAYIFTTPPTQVAGNPAALIGYLSAFDFDVDAPKIFATTDVYTESAMSFMTPPNPTRLDRLHRSGGKMIVFHGASDPVFSYNDTVRWYEALRGSGKRNVRLFTIPGMNHCSGGPAADKFDTLSAIVDWVERNDAPERIVASVRPPAQNPEVPVDWTLPRTRPLCPYPQQARYRGAGDPNDAASFACVRPHDHRHGHHH